MGGSAGRRDDDDETVGRQPSLRRPPDDTCHDDDETAARKRRAEPKEAGRTEPGAGARTAHECAGVWKVARPSAWTDPVLNLDGVGEQRD